MIMSQKSISIQNIQSFRILRVCEFIASWYIGERGIILLKYEKFTTVYSGVKTKNIKILQKKVPINV